MFTSNYQCVGQVVTTSVVYITITDICNNEKPGSCSWYSDCAMGWMIQGWIPGRGNGFPVLQNVQTRSGAHPGSCWMGTRCLFSGAHWSCWRMKLHIVLLLIMTGAVPQLCLCACAAQSGTTLTLPFSLLVANSIKFVLSKFYVSLYAVNHLFNMSQASLMLLWSLLLLGWYIIVLVPSAKRFGLEIDSLGVSYV